MESIGISYNYLQTKTSAQLKVLINNLRNHSSMQAAMITSYTYNPLIGMTSETTPDGKTITYNYGEFNRLSTIRDHIVNGDENGNVIKHFEYHYKEQE